VASEAVGAVKKGRFYHRNRQYWKEILEGNLVLEKYVRRRKPLLTRGLLLGVAPQTEARPSGRAKGNREKRKEAADFGSLSFQFG